MGTRAHTIFQQGEYKVGVYTHWDGYPEGLGKDILEFIDEVSKLQDTRFNDPSYLSAKFIVFMSERLRNMDADWKKSTNPLDFLSIGLLNSHDIDTPGFDIGYIYTIHCVDGNRPSVTFVETCGYDVERDLRQYLDNLVTENA